MNLNRLLLVTTCFVLSVNANALPFGYNKFVVTDKINKASQSIIKIIKTNLPNRCKKHLKSAQTESFKARVSISSDNVTETLKHLFSAENSLVSLNYEGIECKRLADLSKVSLKFLHQAENMLEYDQ